MANRTLRLTVRINGVHETLRAFRQVPKDANDALRTAAQGISISVANAAVLSGKAEGSQAALVATTVKAARDRVPVVVAGGTKKLGRNRKPAYKLLFGSEFGSDQFEQFRPHIGRDSYWFFKTVESQEKQIASRWLQAADEILRKFDD